MLTIPVPSDKLKIARESFNQVDLTKRFNQYAKEKELGIKLTHRTVNNMLNGKVKMKWELWQFMKSDLQKIEAELKELAS